ncbi:MAG: BspA family leucine-rich repeat surface protein [Bacteroidales bacterium]|nr:BspA family leucine-rich repeat surface protein [Bacteroidales bacterium]
MKKIFLFFALLAGIAVMTGCQKDQDVVTLKAVIDHDTKAYFGGTGLLTPYWDGNDRVYVKGYNSNLTREFTRESCSLELPSENSTTFATISNMPVSDVYCAIYPAQIVKSMETPHPTVYNDNDEIVTPAGTSAKITFKHDQLYSEENNHQRLEMPMGAVTTDNTLIFKNLCGILRIKVVNESGSAFDVTRVSVISEDGTFIAGDGIVTLSENGNPEISMSPYQSYTVDQAIQLHTPGGYSSMGTIPSNSNGTSYKTFDIIVPPFSCQKLTFDVETAGHGYFTQTVQGNISIDRNDIVTITLTVSSLQANNHAYLIDGPIFNTLIRGNDNDTAGLSGINGITAIKFCNSGHNPNDYDQVVNLEAAYSPLPVYGFIDDDSHTLIIYSPAEELYANASCKKMFQGLTSIENVYATSPSLFITEDVVDMSYMFAGCRSYHIMPGAESIMVEGFNTTNVETMAHMFDGCSLLNQLDLSSYNTQHLRPNGMVAMFNGCNALSVLNLSSFTTEQITDMSDLFNGCRELGELHINNFDMTHVTNKTDMCLNLAPNRTVWRPAEIWCPSDVQTAISDPTTGIGDVSRFVFHTTTRGNN